MATVAIQADPGRCSGGRLLLVAALSLICCATQAAQTVTAPRYRSALFHYFQQDYFGALTELMIAQQLDAPGAFADNAELLRGGASLSYGMQDEAGRVFARLLAAPGVSADRDRAWFYLGKLAWQHGALDRCASALDNMSPGYHGELAPEANFLRASISLRRGDAQLAASYDTLLPHDSIWLYYLYYNLGANYAAARDWPTAVEFFSRVIQSPLATPEMNSLRDKALTASGYAQLGAGQYRQAAATFARVRLDSPVVERALLGYGWAYSGMGDYAAAITPWQTLAGRSLTNESVREGLLALPRAHEQLGRWHTALRQYRQAGDAYRAELVKVQAAIEAFNNDELSLQPTGDGAAARDWLNTDSGLLLAGQPQYLQHLMSRHDVQLAMRELRDLQETVRFLSGVSGRLQTLRSMEHAREAGQSPRTGPGYAARIDALQARLQAQQGQVQAGLADVRARIRQLAIGELERQAAQLRTALAQARLSVARVYETANAGAAR